MKNEIQQNIHQQICLQLVKMNVCSIEEIHYILEKNKYGRKSHFMKFSAKKNG